MEKIKLYSQKMYDGSETVTLETYVHPTSPEITAAPRPAMVVFPGGGYAFCSDREAEPIASAYYAEGYNCFVLRYICGEKAKVGKPLLDAAMAVAHVRMNAEKYHIDPEKIVISGFSAGGHLAGMLATQWHIKGLSDKLHISNELMRPNAAILGYAVVSCDVKTNEITYNNFLGSDNRSDESNKKASINRLVDERTCPMFIWHTATDDCVPVENSLILAQALTANKIPYELHIFPSGGHGLSRANAETSPDWAEDTYNLPYVARWVRWSFKWLESVFYNGKISFNGKVKK